MISRQIFIIALSLVAMAAGAQRVKTQKPEVSPVVKAYIDSLAASKARIDSSACAGHNGIEERMLRLFAPLTFYHDAAGKALAIDERFGPANALDEAIDEALLNVYLTRPELVSVTERELKQTGGIRDDFEQTVKPKVDLSSKVETMPEATFDDIPLDIVVRKPNFWTFGGDSYLQFLQNYVSDNWYKGGESNYSMVGSLTFKANYNNKKGLKFDNMLELKLGFQTSRADTLHKFKTNNDLIRYTGKFGIQATKRWYYTLQLLAYTQFTKGLKSNDKFVYSDFMSPLNINLGLGMDYTVEAFNKRLKGNVNISPLSFNFRYVGRTDLATHYGIGEGHHTKEDFGSQLTSDLTWVFSDIVRWKTRLYAYTTYKRTEIEWENTFALQVSKYISTNIFIYPRFDDSTARDADMGYWQFKEYCSLGFSYNF